MLSLVGHEYRITEIGPDHFWVQVVRGNARFARTLNLALDKYYPDNHFTRDCEPVFKINREKLQKIATILKLTQNELNALRDYQPDYSLLQDV